MGLAEDPWEKRPRLRSLNVNGLEGNAVPVLCTRRCQGHCRTCAGRLRSLPWSAGSSVPTNTMSPNSFLPGAGSTCMPGGLIAPFHQPAIREYYGDYIVEGERVFVEAVSGRGALSWSRPDCR
ncbi:hypothetical protein L226DRAFT_534943 [Lentinus tigrinus ALCF2SS1-7]|uniref:Uncharacterized protein n=1 Tax=Lentinus tigrinus ALCF2SS1-6 TaxID=1328759 RepID=A0A5C2SA53_9APHY|nr:hypothetical protein L227DRAFT_104128 [Lentinus tigrinus ALCF2SS1-6]RPD74727.1 hypothetical protein L226DRAFT_534943 [Lentinus tigrinus ALCF2SS1-7]